jgi:hypothetical protein
MTTDARALGKTFDISNALSIVDLNTGANTGLFVNMKNAEVCTFVFFAAAGTAGADIVLDLQESDKLTGGTTQDLDIVTDWFKKEETTLDGDETWTRVSQAAASEVTVTDTGAAVEQIYVIEVLASQLSDGFKYLSLNVADASQAKIGGVLAILSDLKVQRKPENLATWAV